MEDVYLNYVCYAILLFSFTFSLASLPTDYGLNASSPSGHRFVEADGVWQLVVVIFLVYTMLPMKTHVAFFMGASLPVAHLAVSAALVHNQTVGLRWQQVSGLKAEYRVLGCAIPPPPSERGISTQHFLKAMRRQKPMKVKQFLEVI